MTDQSLFTIMTVMDDKKERIINSALQLFTTRGFHNTPTSLIAREAGVANGTLFNYFKSKELLINHLYLVCKQSFYRAIEPGLDPDKSIEEQTRSIWLSVISWAENNPEQQAFFQQYRHSPFINFETREEGRLQITPFLTFIQKGMEAGIFKPVSLELLMGILMGIMNATMEFIQMISEREEIRKYSEESFSIVWDALKR